MKKNIFLSITSLFLVTLIALTHFESCKDKESPDKQIIAFDFAGLNVQGVIDHEANTIYLTVPDGTDLTALTPIITVSEKASVNPPSEQEQDFTNPVVYTVTAEDGSIQEYTVVVSYDPVITDFSFEDFSPPIDADIEGNEITLTVPYGSDVSHVIATFVATTDSITVDGLLQISGETANDFSLPVIYTLHAIDGSSIDYTVNVEFTEPSTEKRLLSLSIATVCQYSSAIDTVEYIKGDVNHSENSVSLKVPYGTDITDMLPVLRISSKATVSPQSKVAQDFSEPLTYTVTAEDGSTEDYTVSVEEMPQDTAVRGVWVTNVASYAIYSRDAIKQMLDLCQELNINTVCMVTWNKAMTTYPSKIMEDFTGVAIDPSLGDRDPLQEMIEEAHARNIKVFAWFEYGFAASYGYDGGIIIENKPEWAALNKNGNLVVKNNFSWMNGFDPEVQNFMISLMLEVVRNYDIDGVQGDDRLPSMPVEAGYDDYTVGLYKTQHNGNEPPADESDLDWMQWRVDLLNDFAHRLYDSVKVVDPACVVSSAPHPYSWGLPEYLQDWRPWLENGYIDMVHPQLYRKESSGIYSYQSILSSSAYAAGENKDMFFPGMLFMLGNYMPSNEFLADMLMYNREKGVKGEVLFYSEGLKFRKDILKAFYPAPAIFPTLDK